MPPKRSTRASAKPKTTSSKVSDVATSAIASNLNVVSLKRKSAEETLVNVKQVKKKNKTDAATQHVDLDSVAEKVLETVNEAKSVKAGQSNSNSASSSPLFTGGAFDIYAMPLPFLQKALTSIPNRKEDYAALYSNILEFQAKDDNSGQLAIHIPASTNGYGRLASKALAEPLGDEPYDIGLASIKRRVDLEFTANEKSQFWPSDAIPKGEGIFARLVLTREMCYVSSVLGEFKMCTTPVWKDDERDMIYQGVLPFSDHYSSLLQRKGHGSGKDYISAFWLVPSKETKELECSDVSRLA
ncbi:hypothetical protein V5O48_008575 [Marasmius crinis-equi]|uniref:Uncharacterized protein n=1 Tax=Marasmius crinis-equi TaxID=585013 RepID=A0ABR3FDQ9_9AGAR